MTEAVLVEPPGKYRRLPSEVGPVIVRLKEDGDGVSGQAAKLPDLEVPSWGARGQGGSSYGNARHPSGVDQAAGGQRVEALDPGEGGRNHRGVVTGDKVGGGGGADGRRVHDRIDPNTRQVR